MAIFSKIFKILKNEKYRKNPSGNFLSRQEFSALSIGAINAEQTMAYSDSLATGIDTAELKDNLANYYQIIDQQSAQATLDWLQTRGHRFCYQAIKDVVATTKTTVDDADLTDDEKDYLYPFTNNLIDGVADLIEFEYIRNKFYLSEIDIVAWDAGRLVLVARAAYDCGYISQEVAWQYIFSAQSMTKNVYLDWRGFATAYLVGRAMWDGKGHGLTGLMQIAKELLEDKDSPWQTAFIN